ncbi:DNA-binding protein [bacterium]|nr:MAG: DNA-binding protein [bacterium]
MSVPPLRRRVPGLRSFPAWLELLLWFAFVAACLAALASVSTPQSTSLTQAAVRAMLAIAGQTLDSWLERSTAWLSGHEPSVLLLLLAVLGICWLVATAGAASALRRALQPRPHLGDWWLVRWRREPGPRIPAPPAAAPASFPPHPPSAPTPTGVVDTRAAAAFLGVSQSSVYRWASTGRLPCARTREGLRFNSGELEALRERRARRPGVVRQSGSVA